MILKVAQILTNLETLESTTRWFVYGDIQQISYDAQNREIDFGKDAMPPVDKHFFDNAAEGRGEQSSYNWIVLTFRDGQETTIGLSTIAYLCNDRGDTIQKLDCSHRPTAESGRRQLQTLRKSPAGERLERVER